MKEHKMKEDCIIYNDMPREWITGKNQPIWHETIYKRWRCMWNRCRNPNHNRYYSYKDCDIDERYRYLSNYVKDIMSLENFNFLKEYPYDWVIDKDIRNVDNRNYYFENLSIIRNPMQDLEVLRKRRRPVIGINVKNGSLLVFDFISQFRDSKFNPTNITFCCQGKRKTHKGYRWYYLTIIEL